MGGKLTQRNGQRMAGGKPIPQSSFALPGQRYPIDTVKRARNALSRIAQNGTSEEKAKVSSAVQRRYSQINVGGAQTHANGYQHTIDLDWAAFDAGEKGGASQKAHDTASATASRTAKAHWLSTAGGGSSAAATMHGKQVMARTTSGNTVKGAYNHNTQSVSVPGGSSMSVTHVAPVPQSGASNLSNSYYFADGGSMRCPNCGHTGVYSDFDHDGDNDASGSGAGGASGQNVGATPQPQADRGSTGFNPQQTSVRGGNAGGIRMANNGRGMDFSRRLPVRTTDDIVVSRKPGGGAYIRHRQGGELIGELSRNQDGTTSAIVNGRPGAPHRMERTALGEMIGTYNQGAATMARPAMPLQQPPVQPELFSQLGIQNVRAFASDDSDDSDDSGGSDSNGLTPRGQGIYKKLTGKGVAPKVALAMAKRAQNTTPGKFGQGN